MANGYRLEQEVILTRVNALLTRYAYIGDYQNFYKETWNFLFELRIDLKTAKALNDEKRIQYYESAIHALEELVASIISKQNKNIIEDEFKEGN